MGTDSPSPEGSEGRCLLGSPEEGGEAPSRVLAGRPSDHLDPVFLFVFILPPVPKYH